jgi:acyl-CoA reductase-like NAD-dependent aldehyde dehydrogenase
MQVTGEMIIGQQLVRGAAGSMFAFNPATRQNLDPAFGQAELSDVERACALAEQAFDAYRATTPDARAAFLEAVANNIDALGATLTGRAMAETGLPQAGWKGSVAAPSTSFACLPKWCATATGSTQRWTRRCRSARRRAPICACAGLRLVRLLFSAPPISLWRSRSLAAIRLPHWQPAARLW